MNRTQLQSVNIQIRQATLPDATGIARVHVDSWRSSYLDVVPEELLSGLSYTEREALWDGILNPSRTDVHCFVAETHINGIVGFACGGTARENRLGYEGEIYSIYLRQEYQGMGIGRRLFISVAERLLDDGKSSFFLWVFEENHSARRFYESLWGELADRMEVNIGGVVLVEVAYGWNDIERLVG
ncbi:MAG: GNAT family N-acetyltransferase [Chloroflexi bacterium]|nr:GNAT family N-acetyltransferase [Chloroflexota bacterium]